VTHPTISEIVNGSAAISPEMAISIFKAFGSTPEFWLRLQLNYDLAEVRTCADAIDVERYVRPTAG
jgi:addiction module HigA family antidote